MKSHCEPTLDLPHCTKDSEKSGPGPATFSQPNTHMGLEANEYQMTSKMGKSARRRSSLSNKRKSVLGAPAAFEELDPSPYDPSAPFPLMDLPAELRLMICEYAMFHERDLVWRWKSEVVGKRIGCFIPIQPNYTDHVGPNLITRLRVSRQLRHETMHLWEKFAVLHFDGRDEVPGSSTRPFSPRDGGNIDLAIVACKFFVNHAQTKEMIRVPQIIIDAAYYLNYSDLYAEQLLNLGQDGRFSDIRVVLHEGAHRHPWRFWKDGTWRYLQFVREALNRVDSMDRSVTRRVKIFPCPALQMTVGRYARRWLSAKQFEELMDFIYNGL